MLKYETTHVETPDTTPGNMTRTYWHASASLVQTGTRLQTLAQERLLPALERFRGDERGQTTAEYAIIVVVIGIFLVIALSGLGGSLKSQFNYVTKTIGDLQH